MLGSNVAKTARARQLPIGPYFADFACRESSLVVEIDGSRHSDSRGRDHFRDRTMNSNGWSVLRFWHIDVLQDWPAVLQAIVAALEGRFPEKIVAPDLRFSPARMKEGQT